MGGSPDVVSQLLDAYNPVATPDQTVAPDFSGLTLTPPAPSTVPPDFSGVTLTPPASVTAADTSPNPSAPSMWNLNSILQLGAGLATDASAVIHTIDTGQIVNVAPRTFPASPAYGVGANTGYYASSPSALSGTWGVLLLVGLGVLLVALILKSR